MSECWQWAHNWFVQYLLFSCFVVDFAERETLNYVVFKSFKVKKEICKIYTILAVAEWVIVFQE